MPERPSIWIHRTRRFWFGLLVILFLSGFSLTMGFYTCSIHWFTPDGKPVPYAVFRGKTWVDGTSRSLGFTHGGFQYSKRYGTSRPKAKTYPPKFMWGKNEGYEFLPSAGEQLRFGYYGESHHRVFVPLWPLVATLTAIWTIWMFLAERRDLKRYSNPADPETPSSLKVEN
ncbi:MAG: hypothetical protein AAGI48_01370 [Verrucomicrobiota bacterium]